MNAALRLGYRAAGALARGLAAIAPEASGNKLLRTLGARRGISARYAAWTGRDAARPLLWMHAPSVGEGLQARPVLEIARRERPDLQLAYTHFSPSAERFARALDVDFADYLPFDVVRDVDAALDRLRPTALVFAKLDVWPVLVARAAARGVALGMVSATLADGSSRTGAVARALLGDAYARLDRVGAVDARDAERLVAIGVRRDAITVTGDTRYDQVWARAAAAADRHGPLVAALVADLRPTLVAGSTWPADEAPLLAAWTRLRARHRDVRLVIAPHEPTPQHLAPIEAWARSAKLTAARLDTSGAERADIVVVDRVGVLGDLYAIADAAYIGGGFHAAGLHSVLEPAAFGAPVLFGPRHGRSRDAGLLLAAGGGAMAADSADLERALELWLTDATARAESGALARSVVKAGLGAAERSFALVAALLDARRQAAAAREP